MEPWQQIQAMRVGSSDRGQEDRRPYGTALSEESYPNIAHWAQGHWTSETIAECQRLVKDAIARGSRPLLQVGIVALTKHPDVKRQIWGGLNTQEKERVKAMIAIIG